MWVKMKNGNIEELFDHVANDFIRRGIADPLEAGGVIEKGGPVVIETASFIPKSECAVDRAVKFFRTFKRT